MSTSTAAPSGGSQMMSGMEPSGMSSQTNSRPYGSQSSNARGYSGGCYRSYIEDHLHRMHHDIESTTRKLELERRRLHGLDEALSSAKQEYNTKRQRYKIFQNNQDDEAKKAEQRVKLLEGRLVKAIAELNQGNCENDALREQIDQLRKERQVLDTVFKKLSREISVTANGLGRLTSNIEETKNMDAEKKKGVEDLLKKLEKERVEFKDHCQLMKADLHDQDKIQKEMEVLTERARRSGGKRGGEDRKRHYMVADEEDDFSATSMYRRILKLSFLNAIQRRHIKQHQKNIEVFEQAFNTIKSSTGISDIEEIVKIFVKLEERNYSLLTYVNQLNREIESIEMRNRDLHQQLKEYQEQEEASAVRKRAALSDLSTQIKRTQMAAGEKDRMVEEAALSLVECRPLIWNIVKTLHESLPALANAGYEGEPLHLNLPTPDEHEENLNTYLMYIEEAVLQFRVSIPNCELTQVARPQPKKLQEKNLTTIRPNDLPSAHLAGDTDEDEDGGDPMAVLPLNRSELKSTVERLLTKRRNKNRHCQPHKEGFGGRGAPDQQEQASVEKSQEKLQPSPGKDGSQATLAKSPSMVAGAGAKHEAKDEEAKDESADPRAGLFWRGHKGEKQGGQK